MTGKVMAIDFFFLVILVSSMVDVSTGKVYKVGDDAGWTILGSGNYTAWASSKTFHVGDNIVFVYDKQSHNVMEVRKADYQSCNTKSPIRTYETGNDSIAIRRKGQYFFICSYPGHCAAGQMLQIGIAS